jgi:hypothetical protein
MQLLATSGPGDVVAPELWLVTANSQAAAPGDMKGASIPLHAGQWGLARAFRNEHPEVQTVCLDIDARAGSGAAAAIVDALKRLSGENQMVGESEVAFRRR